MIEVVDWTSVSVFLISDRLGSVADSFVAFCSLAACFVALDFSVLLLPNCRTLLFFCALFLSPEVNAMQVSKANDYIEHFEFCEGF